MSEFPGATRHASLDPGAVAKGRVAALVDDGARGVGGCGPRFDADTTALLSGKNGVGDRISGMERFQRATRHGMAGRTARVACVFVHHGGAIGEDAP